MISVTEVMMSTFVKHNFALVIKHYKHHVYVLVSGSMVIFFYPSIKIEVLYLSNVDSVGFSTAHFILSTNY